jgi:hypothetical protein
MVDHPDLLDRLAAQLAATRASRKPVVHRSVPASQPIQRLPRARQQSDRLLPVLACPYRVPLPELSEVELYLLPLERCGCQSEVPEVCLAGLSPWPGHPGLARLFDCLKCVETR